MSMYVRGCSSHTAHHSNPAYQITHAHKHILPPLSSSFTPSLTPAHTYANTHTHLHTHTYTLKHTNTCKHTHNNFSFPCHPLCVCHTCKHTHTSSPLSLGGSSAKGSLISLEWLSSTESVEEIHLIQKYRSSIFLNDICKGVFDFTGMAQQRRICLGD